MSYYREDFYDECKAYVKAYELIEDIDEWIGYDGRFTEADLLKLKSKMMYTIEFYEKKYHNRILREE